MFGKIASSVNGSGAAHPPVNNLIRTANGDLKQKITNFNVTSSSARQNQSSSLSSNDMIL